MADIAAGDFVVVVTPSSNNQTEWLCNHHTVCRVDRLHEVNRAYCYIYPAEPGDAQLYNKEARTIMWEGMAVSRSEYLEKVNP